MKLLTCLLLWVGACLAVSAADYHWTGAAGDCLWSTAGNWVDSAGNPVAAPTEGVSYTYNFKNCPDGLVVTQDIDVVTSAFAFSTTSESLTTVTWVSAEGKTFAMRYQDANNKNDTYAYIDRNMRVILNCDMSKDGASNRISKQQKGVLAFKLKAANKSNRQLQVFQDAGNPEGVIEFLSGGETPHVGVETQGATAIFRNNECDSSVTALYNGKADNRNNIALGRTETIGHTLAVAAPYDNTTSTNLYRIPVIARDGRLSLRSERTMEARSLPIGGELELARADLTLKGNPLHVIRWTFDDPDDPTKDLLGSGSRMLAPNGMPSVVDDPERGKVIRFECGKYFKGPDANGGLNELFFQTTNNPYAVAFWFKPDANCDKNAKLFFFGEAFDFKGVALRFNVGNDSSKPLMFTPWGDNHEIASDVNIFDGNWHHVVATFNGVKMICVYLDGNLVLKYSVNWHWPSNKNLYVASIYGGWVTDGQNPYTGLMDDFLLTQYFLLESDVKSLYQQGLKKVIGLTSVVAADSGTLSFADRDYTVGALSGDGILGGVEMRGAGKTLTVGAEETSGRGEYRARLRGGDMTLEKLGTNYVQVLAGPAANVTNLVVREGALTVRRPLARRGLVVHYGFDSADDLLLDDGVAGLPMASGDAEPSFVADGAVGGAAHFTNGVYVSSFTNFRPSNFPSGNASYTISVWVRPTAAACEAAAPISCWGRGVNFGLSYLRFENVGELRFSNYSEDLSVTGLGNLADGAWHHIVATYDAEGNRTKKVYVDGELKATKTWAATLKIANDRPLRLGRKFDNSSAPYEGDMDEFMIFDYAWTAQEAADEYARKPAASVAPETLLPQPLAQWTFDDPENLGADSSGNGHHLTQVGDVTSETSEFTCGRAVRIMRETGYFKLDSVPETFPKGSNTFSVVCRMRAEELQSDSYYPTALAWGNANNYSSGQLVKIGLCKTRGGPRITFGSPTAESDDRKSWYFTSSMGTERLRWVTVVCVFNQWEESASCVSRVYYDGRLVASWSKENTEAKMNLQPQDFCIGSLATGESHFDGLIDEVRVYDRMLSEGQVRLISEQLSNSGEIPEALPKKPSVTVAAGATLNISANESVTALSGAGTVNVAPLATLAVGSSDGFTGTFAGEGTLATSQLKVDSLGSLPVLATPGALSFGASGSIDWGEDVVPAGWMTVATAAKGILGVENLSGWTSTGRTDIRFKLSADGKSLLAKVKTGLVLIVR